MYAIVEIAGLQYKVEQDQKLYVNLLQGETGDVVTFNKVLLTDNGSVTVGAPVIEGVAVEAKILEHVKGNKVIVFKKKRRKGYQKSNGHRQQFTKVEIVSIGGGSSAKKSTAKQAEAPKANETNDLSALTVAELKEMAKAKGLEGYSAMKKAELIAALS